jgi:hypothetical protein
MYREEETVMNPRHQGVNIFGYWFTAFEIRVIIIVIVTLIGGLVSIFTDTKFLLPAILGLLLATAWYLLFKRMVR